MFFLVLQQDPGRYELTELALSKDGAVSAWFF